jgi:hypothetical protein
MAAPLCYESHMHLLYIQHHMDSSRIYELEAPKPTESGYAPGGIQVTKVGMASALPYSC